MIVTFAPLAAAAPVLLAISIIDARTHRIPDRLSYPIFVATLAGMTTLAATVGSSHDLRTAMLGSVLFTATLGLLHLIRPDGLGLGDVKLAATLGLLAGWGQASMIDTAMTITWALVLASGTGLIALAVQQVRGATVNRSTALPFGPSLCAGTVVASMIAITVTP